MTRSVVTGVLVLGLAAGSAAAGGGTEWVKKLDEAKQLSLLYGKPILVYATASAEGGC